MMMNFEGPNIRCPHGGELVWVNPDPVYRQYVVLFQFDAAGPRYYVTPEVAESLPEEVRRPREHTIFLVATKDGKWFQWPIRRPVPQEHFVYKAMGKWLRYPVLH
jgi:hypothetical protein